MIPMSSSPLKHLAQTNQQINDSFNATYDYRQ